MWSSMPPPSLELLEQLKSSLPDLNFTDSGKATAARFLATDAVQAYLDYYCINFSAELPSVYHQFGCFQAAGFALACHVWRPCEPEDSARVEGTSNKATSNRGTVWLQHGYTDHVGLCQHAIRWLLQQGYCVVCFDLPGHGLSSGKQASIESFDQYREVLAASLKLAGGALPKPWHAVGQSTGCSVILSLLESATPAESNFERVVLLAPLIRAKGWGRLRWGYYILRLFKQRLVRTFNPSSHDREFLEFLAFRDPLQARHMPVAWLGAMDNWVRDFDAFTEQPHELVIIQGSDDQTVDYRYNLNAIVSTFPHTQVHMIEAAGHQLINEVSHYREQCWSLIGQALQEE